MVVHVIQKHGYVDFILRLMQNLSMSFRKQFQIPNLRASILS